MIVTAVNQGDTVYISEYIQAIWRGKWLITGLVAAAVLLAWLYSSFMVVPVYRSRVTIQSSNLEGPYSDPTAVREILKSEAFIGPVLREINPDYTRGELADLIGSRLSVEANEADERDESDDEGEIFTIQLAVESQNPREAFLITEKISEAFLNEVNQHYEAVVSTLEEKQRYLKEAIERFEEESSKAYANIESIEKMPLTVPDKMKLTNDNLNRIKDFELQKARLAQDLQFSRLTLLSYQPARVLNEAALPGNDINPDKGFYLLAAALLALIIGVFTVSFRAFLRRGQPQQTGPGRTGS